MHGPLNGKKEITLFFLIRQFYRVWQAVHRDYYSTTFTWICRSGDCRVFFYLHFWELFCFIDFIYLLTFFSFLFWRRTCVTFSFESFVKYDIICIHPFKVRHYDTFSWNYLCLQTIMHYLLRLRRRSESSNKSKYLTQEVTRM